VISTRPQVAANGLIGWRGGWRYYGVVAVFRLQLPCSSGVKNAVIKSGLSCLMAVI